MTEMPTIQTTKGSAHISHFEHAGGTMTDPAQAPEHNDDPPEDAPVSEHTVERETVRESTQYEQPQPDEEEDAA